MESEISLDVIKSTQETLGKFVKRPALSDKLLKKPPFRFLHDIVTHVLKTTGFLQGLYTEDELVSENVNNRDGKIAFLTKLIAVVSLVIEKPLSARPSKIIAGQEPEKTNELLQSIGIVLEKKLSSDSAVKIYNDKSKSKREKDGSNSKDKRNIKPDTDKKKDEIKKENIAASKPPKKIQRDNSISRLSDKSRPEKVSSREKLQAERSVTRIDVSKGKEKKQRVSTEEQLKSKAKPAEKEQKLPPKASARSSKSLTSLKSSHEGRSKRVITEDQEDQLDPIQIDKEVDSLKPENINTSNTNVKVQHEIDDAEKSTGDSRMLPISDIGKQDISSNIGDNSLESQKDLFSIDHSSFHNDLNHNLTINTTEKAEKENEKAVSNNTVPSETKIKADVSKAEPYIINMQMENEIEKVYASKEDLITPKETFKENNADAKVTSNYSEEFSERKAKGIQKTATIENFRKQVQNTEENKDVNKSKSLLRPPSARPPSARPGAPRLKDKNDVILNQTEQIVSGKVNVIVEKYGADNEDDDGSLVMVESNIDTVDSEKPIEEVSQVIGAGHGHLVQQILNTQSDFKRKQGGNVEIEWEFGARKAKEAYTQEIENIRTGLQGVSRAANPLGKLFDHIQEDVEVMRQELDSWKEVYKQASRELAQQRSLTEQSTMPLQSKLRQLDANIVDKRDQIHNLKAQMYKNSAEIDKLLDCNNVQ